MDSPGLSRPKEYILEGSISDSGMVSNFDIKSSPCLVKVSIIIEDFYFLIAMVILKFFCSFNKKN